MGEPTPALSAEEWKASAVFRENLEFFWHVRGVELRIDDDERVDCGPTVRGDGPRHALAALCLYQQPFGFTAEDVEALNEAVAELLQPGNLAPPLPWQVRSAKALRSLASRIAALLPPQP